MNKVPEEIEIETEIIITIIIDKIITIIAKNQIINMMTDMANMEKNLKTVNMKMMMENKQNVNKHHNKNLNQHLMKMMTPMVLKIKPKEC